MQFIRKLIKNSKGATAIEYGLIAALIAVAAITAMQGLGTSLKGDLQQRFFGDERLIPLTSIDVARGGGSNSAALLLSARDDRSVIGSGEREEFGAALRARTSSRDRGASASSSSPIAAPSVAIAPAGSRWAPPTGSGTIRSITPSCFRSCAVTRIASAASAALSAVRHRIEAQPSGEITA